MRKPRKREVRYIVIGRNPDIAGGNGWYPAEMDEDGFEDSDKIFNSKKRSLTIY